MAHLQVSLDPGLNKLTNYQANQLVETNWIRWFENSELFFRARCAMTRWAPSPTGSLQDLCSVVFASDHLVVSA